MTVGTILSGKKHELLPTAKPKKSKSKKDRKGIVVSAVFVSLSILKVHKNCYAIVESKIICLKKCLRPQTQPQSPGSNSVGVNRAC